MKNKLLIILLLLLTNSTFSQIKGIVFDSISKEPIPYVNIWVENENIGATSDQNGKFEFSGLSSEKVLVFSAIGYYTKRTNASLNFNEVKLVEKVIQLSKVVIFSTKQITETVIGKFKRHKINYYWACGKNPWINARFFPYKSEYEKTPFLKTIEFFTSSEVKDSKFNIRLYSVNENGEPDNYMTNQVITGTAKKGGHLTKVDLSDLYIRFPKNGFFIAVEWLIIEHNKVVHYMKKSTPQKPISMNWYSPSFGTIGTETDENNWVFSLGKWSKTWKNKKTSKYRKENYNLIAIKLVLTN